VIAPLGAGAVPFDEKQIRRSIPFPRQNVSANTSEKKLLTEYPLLMYL
jgi:hypothetical protein